MHRNSVLKVKGRDLNFIPITTLGLLLSSLDNGSPKYEREGPSVHERLPKCRANFECLGCRHSEIHFLGLKFVAYLLSTVRRPQHTISEI